jgi:peptidoglycan/LPS O-acetylase OafA/YrhL
MFKTNRLLFIDSLRGFAAVYVLLFHSVLIPDPHIPYPNFIKPFILNGFVGVTLFFVISAFTLCYTLDGKQYDTSGVKKFFVRRVFRIVPLYYLWLFIVLVMYWSAFPKRNLILYGLFGYNFVPGEQEGQVWASWTLGVEMVFYLIFPFIFRYTKSLKKALLFLCITLAISFLHRYLISLTDPSIKTKYNIYFSIFSQMPVFATGIISYFVFKKLRDSRTLGVWILWSSLLVFVGFPYFVQTEDLFEVYLMMIVFGSLLIGLSLYQPKIFVNKFSVFLGLISYSLYLNHPRIVFYLSPLYKRVAAFNFGDAASFLICSTITLILVICISYVTFKLIEEPGMRLGRMIINRMTKMDVAKAPS